MSEFNKEQLVIFINNLFIVIGTLFTYHTITTAYDYYLLDNYSNMIINLFFGLAVGTIAFWLFYTALRKGMKEFIKAGFPNGFISELSKQLQINIDAVDSKISDKKKEINIDEDDEIPSDTKDSDNNED
jgi:F0F1-type ATP synthase membrane subunit a